MLVTNLQPQLESAMVGAKAANLGRVIENGLSVPFGFVVTRDALTHFLQHASLETLVETYLNDKGQDRAKAYDDICHQIQIAPIPHALDEAVAKQAEPLFNQAPGAVAVRSSGIHEDSAMASFAGIYQSYLGIRSVEELWAAIKRCWCSAWSPQAIAYASKMGIRLESDSMAVLIQQLVDASRSGVLFTANPRTGNPWQFVLESTFGLAQELVGSVGNVPADRFMLTWDDGSITARHIAQKPTTCVLGDTGIETVPLTTDRGKTPSLSDEIATSIAQLGLSLDRLFDCRVDVEWAMAHGEIQIVQVRPITALPPFFPHHLPPNLADQHWQPLWPYWYFPNNELEGSVVPPLYHDLSFAEMFVRYQIGPFDLHNGRFSGRELDFNGYRYHIAQPRLHSSKPTLAELDAYMQEYEPVLRQQWLEAKHDKFPAIVDKAAELRQQANSLTELIDALLWARDADFDLSGQLIGPPQCLFGVTIDLFDDFVAGHLPDQDVEPLRQGHHPALEPYYPHTQVKEAEALAATIKSEAVRQAFATMAVQPLFQFLVEYSEPLPFVQAYNDFCERLGLVPLNRYDEIYPNEKVIHYSVLQVIGNALQGKHVGLAMANVQIGQQRQACEANLRQILVAKGEPKLLARFEKLVDWLYFWAPALNDRGWGSVPIYQIRGLWMVLCRKLQAIGLVDSPTDIGYFKLEDLAYIARIDDVAEGRRIWRRRRLDYERQARLQPPAYLGKAPTQATTKPQASEALAENMSSLNADNAKTVIQGRGHSAGQAKGVAYKIETLQEADTATEQHILIITKTVTPTSQYSALLLSLILRVRGIIIVQAGQTYTHHIAQVARECGVPVLEVAEGQMDDILDNSELVIDGLAGTVTIVG